MMWYDAFSNKNSTLFKSSLRKNNKKLLNVTCINSINKNKLSKPLLTYIIPAEFNILILFNRNLNISFVKIFSTLYFFILPVVSAKGIIKFDYNSRQILISIPYVNNFFITYFSVLNFLYKVILKPNLIKIKFKGKGYYI
jgi:hypothetical protein